MKNLFLSVSCLMIFSCGEKTREFEKEAIKSSISYRNIIFRESPFADIKGIIELTEEEAKTSFHYLFDYDSIGRITKLTQKIGANNAVFQSDLNRFFVKSAILEITYPNDSTELRKYLNHFGEDSPTREGVLYEKFEYDDDGNRKKLTFLNADKKPVQNDWSIMSYEWTKKKDYILEKRYDSTGSIVAMRPQLNFYNVGLHYDNEGFISKFTNYNDTGELVNTENGMASDHIAYNENGNFITWKTFDEHGKNVFNKSSGIAQGENLINDKGQPFITYYLDTIGNLTESVYGYAKFETLYDTWGNVKGWRFYDPKDKLLTLDDNNVVSNITEFNDRRQRISYSFIDKEGGLVDHAIYGFAKILYNYDEKDRIKKESFFTADGKPFFMKQRNAATIEYIYDENDVRTMKLLDETGELIK